jgi:hypothetical protein
MQLPAPRQHPAGQGVVYAQLSPLGGDPRVARHGALVVALGVAGMQPGHDPPADVVQERGQGELVALANLDQLPDAIRGALDGERVQAELLGAQRQPLVLLEEVMGRGALNRLLDPLGAEHLHRLAYASHPLGAGNRVGGPDHGDRQADVGLDHPVATSEMGAPRASRVRARWCDSFSAGKCSVSSKAADRSRPLPGRRCSRRRARRNVPWLWQPLPL